jgi:hypothetical protein
MGNRLCLELYTTLEYLRGRVGDFGGRFEDFKMLLTGIEKNIF